MKLQQLNPQQLENAKKIDNALVKIGLTNKFLRSGILAVCSKESGFMLKSETSYKNTPNERILKIFGAARFAGYDLNVLKQNEVNFFNVVYNRKDLGNGPTDGYKFRGRGFNQLTGRANYRAVGAKIKIDIEGSPDLMSDPDIAALALAQFFRDSIIAGQYSGKCLMRFGIVTTSQIKDIQTGARLAHQANMGWKNPPEADPTGGFEITMNAAPTYLEITSIP